MAVTPDSVDPFAPPQQQQNNTDPAHAALEENLAQLLTSLSTLTTCVSNVVPEAVEPTSNLAGGLVGHTMSQMIIQLHELQRCARHLNTDVPVEAINLVDQNKNPDLHLKSFVENAALENMYTNGLVNSVQSYREELNSQLADFFPDLVEPDNSTTAGNSQHSEVDPVKPEGATI